MAYDASNCNDIKDLLNESMQKSFEAHKCPNCDESPCREYCDTGEDWIEH